MVSIVILTSAVGGIIGGVTGAVSGIFGGDQSKEISVQVNDANKQGQNQISISYDKGKDQLLQLINTGERLNVLPEVASVETKDLLHTSKKDFKKMNIQGNIEDFFNDISFDPDENGNLDVKVEGNKDYLYKADLKEYLAKNTDLSEQEINGSINKWENNIQEAVENAEKMYAKTKQKAVKYANKTANAIATFSISSFFVFLLGAAAGMFGGSTGSPEYTEPRNKRIVSEHTELP